MNGRPNEILNSPRASNLDDPIAIQYVHVTVNSTGRKKYQFKKNISKVALDEQSRGELLEAFSELRCKVTYWDRESVPSLENIPGVLNRIGAHLTGLASDSKAPLVGARGPVSSEMKSSSVRLFELNKLQLWFSDDDGQANTVQLESLPSGWRAFASVIFYLETQEKGTVCLLEEPETHLHPTLQRLLGRRILEIADERELQVFLATHSVAMQSRALWVDSTLDNQLDVRYFEADGHSLYVGVNERRLFDALGISGAEYGVANGLIWVEGPSDRIYFEHWINLFCEFSGVYRPVEHVDYCYAFHGGSLLTHFDVTGGPGKIDITRINRNYFLVMDRDLEPEELVEMKIDATKGRVITATIAMGSTSVVARLTPGYTIESSLPSEFRELYFRNEGDRLKHYRGKKLVLPMPMQSDTRNGLLVLHRIWK